MTTDTDRLKSFTKLNHIALVGLGSIGRRHLRLIKSLKPEMEITLVRSGKGLDWPESELADQEVNNIDQALGMGADAAILASPSSMHLQQLTQWLKAGKPVMVEKPLSNNLKGLEELTKLAESKEVPVLLGYVLRYDLAAKYFYEQLSSGIYGKPLCVRIECGSFLKNWRSEQDYRQTVSALKELGGGVLLELSHEIDYANWFFGPYVSVQAFLQHSGSLDIEVEDSAELILMTEADVPVSIHLDFYRKVPKRYCTVQTTDGEFTWDCLAQVVRFTNEKGVLEEKIFLQEREELFRRQFVHFVKCADGLDQPLITLGEGIQVMQLIEAFRESHSSGRRVTL